MLISILTAILLAVSFYMFFANALRVPSARSSKAVISLGKRQRGKVRTLKVAIDDLCLTLGNLLRLNPYKRAKLATDLKAANISDNPETYTMRAILKAISVLPLLIPVYFTLPILIPAVLFLSILMYFNSVRAVNKQLEEKRKKIEADLPRLVFTIDKAITLNRDIIGILERFKKTCGKELAQELEITIAAMRSGSEEAALTRLESRVGSSALSEVIRGLIKVIQGDDTRVYWDSLSFKFAEVQRQGLKAEAVKVPGKVRKLSFALLACFGLMYIVVLVVQIISSLTDLF